MKVAFYDKTQFAFQTTFKNKEEFRDSLRLLILSDNSISIRLKSCITEETNFANTSGYDFSVYVSDKFVKLDTNQGKSYYLKNTHDLRCCEFFEENKGKLVEFIYEGKTRFLQVLKECDVYLEGNDATILNSEYSYRKFIKNKVSNLKVLAELC